MNFVKNGIYNINEINENNIVDFIDVNKNVNVNILENKILNENNFKISENIEILSIDVKLSNKSVKKIQTINTNIYIFNFIYTLNIKLYIDYNVKDIQIDDLCTKTIMYKDIKISNFDINVINLDSIIVNDKIGFFINFIILDNYNDPNIQMHNKENHKKNQSVDNIGYSYIDIETEFI